MKQNKMKDFVKEKKKNSKFSTSFMFSIKIKSRRAEAVFQLHGLVFDYLIYLMFCILPFNKRFYNVLIIFYV